MNFYLISQAGSGAWAQQYNMNLEPVGARTYEPDAYLPSYTYSNAMLMLKFYQYTGDRKYLSHIPDAINWLEEVRLPNNKTENGSYTHPQFVEIGTNTPIYVHRKGSNVNYGKYYIDSSDQGLLGHYSGKTRVNIQTLKDEYARVSALSPQEATRDSPIKPSKFENEHTPQTYYSLNRNPAARGETTDERIKGVIEALDNQNRWLIKHAMTSNPYIGDGQKKEETNEFASTNMGDETDTSPYRDLSDQEYISTPEYIRNMSLLIKYLHDKK